jgi:hypothetical protein
MSSFSLQDNAELQLFEQNYRDDPFPSDPTRHDHDPEPIAVPGIGCRFPGEIESSDVPRQLDASGDVIADLPNDRGRDLDALLGSDPEGLGASYARRRRFGPGTPKWTARQAFLQTSDSTSTMPIDWIDAPRELVRAPGPGSVTDGIAVDGWPT